MKTSRRRLLLAGTGAAAVDTVESLRLPVCVPFKAPSDGLETVAVACSFQNGASRRARIPWPVGPAGGE